MTIITKPPDRAHGGHMPTAYEQDFLLWTEEQAAFLRDRNFDQLDIEHLIDEIISMGKSEIRELESRMAVLLAHLIKWAWQPAMRGNSRSWEATIESQRSKIGRLFKNMPSLRTRISADNLEFWVDVWRDARIAAEKETGINYSVFPEEMPWTKEQILDEHWYPDSMV